MTRRILRTIPLAVLMTTALSWNLPATAQGMASPPPAASAGPAQKSPPNTGAPVPAPAAEPADRDADGRTRLPADLRPALPASASDKPAPADGSQPRGSQPPAPKQ